MALWVAEANRMLLALPRDVQEALLRHEAAGTTAHPEHEAATQAFYRRRVRRLDPWPGEVGRTFAAMASDPTFSVTINGPNDSTSSARCATGASSTVYTLSWHQPC